MNKENAYVYQDIIKVLIQYASKLIALWVLPSMKLEPTVSLYVKQIKSMLMEVVSVSMAIIALMLMVNVYLLALHMRKISMDFVNVSQGISELHWVFVFLNKLDLELVHQELFSFMVNVSHQHHVESTNIGAEVDVPVFQDSTESMDSVYLSNPPSYAPSILNQMVWTVYAREVFTLLYLDHVIDVLQELIGMERAVLIVEEEIISVRKVGYGILSTLAVTIQEIVVITKNGMEQAADANKVSS